MEHEQILAIIPARGGSEGIKDKNIRDLCGKPLIYYTIKSAQEANIIDRIVLSTDSQKIAEIAKQYNVDVPFMRPKQYSMNKSKQMDVITHAMDWFKENDKEYDFLIYLQPTSPLRSYSDIINSFELLKTKNANAIISVTEACEHHPLWMNKLPKDGDMKNFIRPDIKNTNRQDLPSYYRLNGAIYLAKWNYLEKHKDWFKEKCYAYIMPAERSVDIDNEIDFIKVDYILKKFIE